MGRVSIYRVFRGSDRHRCIDESASLELKECIIALAHSSPVHEAESDLPLLSEMRIQVMTVNGCNNESEEIA